MAWNESHKKTSRAKILAVAADLFTRRGFSGVGIDEIMQTAGLTRGAFYAHFESKVELFEEAMVNASKATAELLSQGNPFVENIIENYLSEMHLESAEVRCPLSSLVSDAAHQDERIKKTYTKIFKGLSAHIAKTTGESAPDTALLQAVLMVGGMAVARSLTDKVLAKQILEICRNHARDLTIA